MSHSELSNSEIESRASCHCECESESECEPKPGPSQVNYDSDDDEDDDQCTSKQFNICSSLPDSLPCNSKCQQPHSQQVYLIAEPKSEKSTEERNSHHPKLHQLLTISLLPVNDVDLLETNEYISADVLILKELNQMKIILNQLLEQNRDLTLLQSSNGNPTSALVSMVEEDLNVLALIKHRALGEFCLLINFMSIC